MFLTTVHPTARAAPQLNWGVRARHPSSTVMGSDTTPEAMRRATARRMARNLVAMTDASEAEFAEGERAVGAAMVKALLVSFGLAFVGILGSGWATWAQVAALAALAIGAAVLRVAWLRLLPPPLEPPPTPPFERLTPRPGRRLGRRPPAP